MFRHRVVRRAAAVLLCGSAGTGAAMRAQAQQVQSASPSPAAAPGNAAPLAPTAPKSWVDGITYGALVDGGITGNFDRPSDGLNYGRLFDDKSNSALLNTVQLTAQRAIDSSSSAWDFGFTLQGAYGSDARYTHYLGEFDYASNERYQFSLLQADVLAHAPIVDAGGIDFKLGQFATPIGFETIDPTANPFYSHSYAFNFGPFEHTGLQAVFHVSPILDVWGQVDTGESTTFDGGDNNAEPAGLVGIGLNGLLDKKLTVLWLTHLGPDDAVNAIGHAANSSMRYESDVVLNYKFSDKLTFNGEGQWQHDDYYGADSYGFAGYASYALTPSLTANFRGEIYRDNAGFFVAAFPGNLDPVRALNGIPNRSYTAGRQTYSEWTWGVTYRPTVPHLQTLAFRPEIRWDKSLSGGHPFNGLTDTGMFTLAADVMIGF